MDGRDIMFFRCEDLEIYTKEVNPNKDNYIVINKADLLKEEIRYLYTTRKLWSDYLNEKGINHIFFSALEEQQKID